MKKEFLDFLDNYIKKYFVLVPILILTVIWLFQQNDFLGINLGRIIFKNGGAYSTLASIFAGIFFSLYTLLLSLPNFSVVKKLTKQNYKYLLMSITFGLICSLGFCILQVFIPMFNKNNLVMGINFLFFLAFILSVIQCTIYFTLELHSDLNANFQKEDQIEMDVKYIKEWVKTQE